MAVTGSLLLLRGLPAVIGVTSRSISQKVPLRDSLYGTALREGVTAALVYVICYKLSLNVYDSTSERHVRKDLFSGQCAEDGCQFDI